MIKIYNSILVYLIFFITIFSLQLYFFAHEHSQCNILLIAYVFLLFNHYRLITLSTLAIMLDALTYINTHVAGLSILWLTFISWMSIYIKDDMYNKIVLPCLFIFLYAIFYNITLAYYLHAQTVLQIIGNIIISTVQNCCGLVLIWQLSKKPFHD